MLPVGTWHLTRLLSRSSTEVVFSRSHRATPHDTDSGACTVQCSYFGSPDPAQCPSLTHPGWQGQGLRLDLGPRPIRKRMSISNPALNHHSGGWHHGMRLRTPLAIGIAAVVTLCKRLRVPVQEAGLIVGSRSVMSPCATRHAQGAAASTQQKVHLQCSENRSNKFEPTY